MSKEWDEYLQLMKERPEDFRQSKALKIITDESSVLEYEAKNGVEIGVVYSSPYHFLVVDLVEDRQGRGFTYERLLPAVKSGAVVIIPIWEDRFVLLRQYRHALRDYQYAFPRGFATQGLSSAENVKKELSEELGAVVETAVPLGSVVADSGVSGNKVCVYACRVRDVKLQRGHEGIEDIVTITGKELDQWIADGRITDGFTLSAVTLYKCYTVNQKD